MGTRAPKQETVFLIDDDREVRERLRTLLQLDGYKVKTARDGQHALAQLRGGLRPCIIVLDLKMPGMDGPHFRAEQLRDPELAHIPVIIFSREQDPPEEIHALGVAAYLCKSAHIDSVLHLIETHCVRQQGAQPSSASPAPERPAVTDW